VTSALRKTRFLSMYAAIRLLAFNAYKAST
jgi:hypothetical protein